MMSQFAGDHHKQCHSIKLGSGGWTKEEVEHSEGSSEPREAVEMKSLLVLLWLCVAVGSSYPLHSSANSGMEFLQVRGGNGLWVLWQGTIFQFTDWF